MQDRIYLKNKLEYTKSYFFMEMYEKWNKRNISNHASTNYSNFAILTSKTLLMYNWAQSMLNLNI